MFVEFDQSEKEQLLKAGFTEEPNYKWIHADENFQEFFIEMKKLPDLSIEVTVHFLDGEVVPVKFTTFDSFMKITNLHI